MTAMTQTAIPQPTPYAEHARCHHGQDITGYVVAYSHFNAVTGITTFEDIEHVEGSTNYDRALEIVHAARARVMNGQIAATCAVIHHVYGNGHRPY